LWEKSPFTAHKPSELNRIPECGLSGWILPYIIRENTTKCLSPWGPLH
jgi:hypothetical protein